MLDRPPNLKRQDPKPEDGQYHHEHEHRELMPQKIGPAGENQPGQRMGPIDRDDVAQQDYAELSVPDALDVD
jgi:hypothetical protein